LLSKSHGLKTLAMAAEPEDCPPPIAIIPNV